MKTLLSYLSIIPIGFLIASPFFAGVWLNSPYLIVGGATFAVVFSIGLMRKYR